MTVEYSKSRPVFIEFDVLTIDKGTENEKLGPAEAINKKYNYKSRKQPININYIITYFEASKFELNIDDKQSIFSIIELSTGKYLYVSNSRKQINDLINLVSPHVDPSVYSDGVQTI